MIIFNKSSVKELFWGIVSNMNWVKCLILSICMYDGVCFAETLEEFVSALEKKPYFKQASIAIYVAKEDGGVLLNHNGEKSMIPNSIVKLFTTAAALKVLGEEFCFRTQICTTAPVIDGTLLGDLIIHGGGDPSLGADDERQLKIWADQIEAHQIKTITGSIIGDASCFEKALSPASWLWEDIGNYYGAGACGLNFHENTYQLLFKLGQEIGAVTTIESIKPSLPNITIVNEVVSAPKGSGDQAYIFGGEFSTLRYVRGTVPLDHTTFTIRGSIPDPAKCCAEQLKEELRRRGIQVYGEARSLFTQETDVSRYVLYESHSPQLSEMVYTANQRSMNLYCESFLKKMGQVQSCQGTHIAGAQVINEYLKELKFFLEGVKVVDGSGLSNKNLVTARGMVEFLSKVAQEPYFLTLLRSLPSNGYAGNKRLNTLFPSKSLEGRVCAKTGFSSQGKSIAGFLTTKNGQELRFCVIINHFLAPVTLVNKEMEALLELLLEY